MNPFVNLMASDKPLALFIGRRRQMIQHPWRLEIETEVTEIYPDDLPVVLPGSQSVRLFVDNKLFAVSRVSPYKRYAHRALKIFKPKRGSIQIHLTKKYTELA